MKISKRLAALSAAAVLLNTTSAVLCSSGISFSLAASAAEVHNPVIWSDVPDNDVIRVGDTYYMVSTTESEEIDVNRLKRQKTQQENTPAQSVQPVQKSNIIQGVRKVLQQSGGSKDGNREHEVGGHGNYNDIDDERKLKR